MKTKTARYNDYQRKLTKESEKYRLWQAAKMLAQCIGTTPTKLMKEFNRAKGTR
jgi:hypothetical protein